MRFFGREGERIAVEDAERVVCTPQGALHIARHFRRLSDSARAFLRGEHVDDTFLNDQLKSYGSKFHPALDDPRRVIELAHRLLRSTAQSKNLRWIARPDGGRMFRKSFFVSAQEKEQLGMPPGEALGTCGIIKLTPTLYEQLRKELRGARELADRVTVNVVKDVKQSPQDDLVVGLRWRPEASAPEFVTIFTGIVAPDLPWPENQSPEEEAYNRAWWNDHAFIALSES